MPELSGNQLLSEHRVIEWVPADEPVLVHIAVSFAGRLLADLGATVTRVVPEQDPLNGIKSFQHEDTSSGSLLSTYLGRFKGRVDTNQVQTILQRDRSVLVLAGRQGINGTCGYKEAEADDIPVVSATAIDSTTDSDDLPVSELGIQGVVGLTDLFGEPGAQPLMMGGHQTAYATGYSIFCAAMGCLTKLKFLNQVDSASVNALDTLAWVNWKGVAAGALGFPVVRGGKGAEAPVVRCANGYFAFMHLPNNWEDIRAEIADPRLEDEQFSSGGRRAKNALALNEIIGEWAADKTWQQLYAFCQQSAVPGGPVLGGAELLADPLYLHRQFFDTAAHVVKGETREVRLPGLPMTVEDTSQFNSDEPASRPSYVRNAPRTLPLSGKLVIDLGIFTAGSVTSTLLADLGATVIKVESESYSDPFRIWPGIKGDSPLFTFNNRNKLGLNLDLKTDDGRLKFLKLIEQADVVVENFRRGVLARLGIDYPVLKKANPRIVLASISGQGASGPGSGHVSFGSTLEAIGGVASLTGYPGQGCYISGRNLNYPDQIVCLYGAGATMAALLKVQETGYGMHIDVSQREVTTLAVGEMVAAASVYKDVRRLPAGFSGNRDINAVLQDIFPVADGWLCVTVSSETQANALAAMLGCTQRDLETELVSWLGEQNAVTCASRLRAIGIASFTANTGAQASEEPAIKSGTAFATTQAGKMVKGFPFQFTRSPLTVYAESPSMGEHTQHVLEILESQV
ncbi:MAG: CoA transferase [Pseudomonadota bacterium]